MILDLSYAFVGQRERGKNGERHEKAVEKKKKEWWKTEPVCLLNYSA